MKDVYIVCCLIEPSVKRPLAYYFLCARVFMKSLLETGFDASNIYCICENNKRAKQLSSEFGVNGIHGPKIPKKYSHIIIKDKPKANKLFFYKPISLQYITKGMFPKDNTNICMVDLDEVFVKNPKSIGKLDGVWTQSDFRYLRPTRQKRLKDRLKNPRIDNKEDLSGYFGDVLQAELFLKYKLKNLPSSRVVSNFMVFPSNSYENIIDTWMDINDYVLVERPKIVKGDQDTLSFALHYMGLEFGVLGDNAYTESHSGADKKSVVKCAKKYGLI